MIKSWTCLILFLLGITMTLIGQNGYHINIDINGYDQPQLILGYQYGNKQYIKDTVNVNDKGQYIFKGEENLSEGTYLLVMIPNNNFVNLLVDDENQNFSMKLDTTDLVGMAKIKGSPLNQNYFEYLKYLESKVPAKQALQDQYDLDKEDAEKVEMLRAKMKDIDDEVKAHHQKLIVENDGNLFARMTKARIDIDIPEFEGDDADLQRYLYYKAHYFDNMDLKDEGLLRSNVLFQRVDYYMNKLTPQIPDSINQSLDYILSEARGSNNFKFFLIHYLNTYAASKIVGMDAVYVHLVEKYYAKGDADWTSEEQLKKIVDNALVLKNILIGKTAPNLTLKTEDNQDVKIHDIDSEYTVLFFWDPDCGHCKKSLPDVKAFYDKWQSQGVEMIGICTKVGEEKEMKKCWDTIEEKEIGEWINVSDQYLRSGYKQIYDITSTPRIFILDSEKKIVMKGIGGDQLDEVMEGIVKQKEAGL